MPQLVEAVPNFAEGRDMVLVERLRHEVTAAGAHLLDIHSDPDHNRTVLTLAGFETGIVEGLMAGIDYALRHFDLRNHEGVHPRVGVADVVPLVPLGATPMSTCVELAYQLGERIWNELRLPVFFYAEAARQPGSVNLAAIRAGRAQPDLGDLEHPRGGAVCVGARGFLVAYNVMLPGATFADAAALARRLRESSGGLEGVQALAFALAPARMQLSMNLRRLEINDPRRVLQEIHRIAGELGIEVGQEEFVGLCPARFAPLSADGHLLEARIGSAAAREGAARCRELGGDEHESLAARLAATAPPLGHIGAEPEEMLSAAERAAAIKRVIRAGGCSSEELEAMLDYAAIGLRAALPADTVARFRKRVDALERWLAEP